MLNLITQLFRQNPLIMTGWLLLIISLFLPAFSSDKGVIYGFQAAIIGGVYAIQMIVIDLFVTDGLLIPVDDINQMFVSSGFEYLGWLFIYFSIAVASCANLLFLSIPAILKNAGKREKSYKYISKILWISVLCSLVSGLYVILGFHEMRIGYFVWVASFIFIAIGFRSIKWQIERSKTQADISIP